ncbi:MAG: cryptochrome/photolyase family protein [Thiocapsa sp.]|jgi:deoxyribodipyrimidine photolyase-related protein|nr:cryptochrome/photolyase family protein [Thiocapsa sp.]MCG6898305.1 cryptochrome/photolyase family protein [Thiocapsa sp.]MCG6984877.1 cryptochrome/photolyase family protein [Thiocapsa sp.]
MQNPPCRHLVLVLGDQLDPRAAALRDLDPVRDQVWMCEAVEESTHVPSHRARILLFLSAMRRFRDRLAASGVRVHYRALDVEGDPSLAAGLRKAIDALRPGLLILTEPGEHRVLLVLEAVAAETGVPLEVRRDAHFICSRADFDQWAEGRKALRQEHFYRHLRRREGILTEGTGDALRPVGGKWNLDQENRKAFGRKGPGRVPRPLGFPPDETTRALIGLIQRRFPDAPGSLDGFDWPLTQLQANQALDDFVRNRLPAFGPWQDAMWTGEPYLYHARLSAGLNLKLLDPRAAVGAAVEAFEADRAPLASVEGFVRQILGWREYVRGIYWRAGPGYPGSNALEAHQPLPAFYWDGRTECACLATVVGQVLEHGYAHHIQRLMVTGLFALLLGVEPRAIHAWYLAMFVDAVEWVEAPNVIGMSQFADGGVLASKPYVASGQYINRMSNYCGQCRFDPGEALGENACPFTTLYWDFLARHEGRFAAHPRTALQWRALARLGAGRQRAIRRQADGLRAALA